MRRAQVSTDKTFVKKVIQSFALELLSDDIGDLRLAKVPEEGKRAGGADYGTGIRSH